MPIRAGDPETSAALDRSCRPVGETQHFPSDARRWAADLKADILQDLGLNRDPTYKHKMAWLSRCVETYLETYIQGEVRNYLVDGPRLPELSHWIQSCSGGSTIGHQPASWVFSLLLADPDAFYGDFAVNDKVHKVACTGAGSWSCEVTSRIDLGARAWQCGDPGEPRPSELILRVRDKQVEDVVREGQTVSRRDNGFAGLSDIVRPSTEALAHAQTIESLVSADRRLSYFRWGVRALTLGSAGVVAYGAKIESNAWITVGMVPLVFGAIFLYYERLGHGREIDTEVRRAVDAYNDSLPQAPIPP